MSASRSPAIPAAMPSGRAWPRITVVTPTFNRAHMLENTIRSVLDQDYPNLEYIVMDGGSTDNSADIIRKFEDRLYYWESVKDRGQSHALNKGFSRATGELLTWLNSDDILEPDALFSIALAYDESPSDLIVGLIQLLYEGNRTGFHMTSASEGPLRLAELLDIDGTWNAGKFFFQPEVVFTRDIWDRSGGFVDEKLHYSMDYDLWCRMAHAGARIKVIGRPICGFLIHPEQKTLGNAESKFKSELSKHARTLITGYATRPDYRATGHALARIAIIADLGIKYGAGIANKRIAMALATAGHPVEVLSLETHLQAGGHQARHPKISDVLDRLRRLKADIVIFGNIHAVDLPPAIVTEVGKHFPTFIITHDLWWLTGRSTYPLETGDPLLSEAEDLRLWAEYPRTLPGHAQRLRSEKTAMFRSPHAPNVLANSQWSAEVFERTLQRLGSPSRTFRLTIPVPPTYRPMPKGASRHKLGLPQDKFIVAISATDLADRRKRTRMIFEALSGFDPGKVGVALVGREPATPLDLGLELFTFGHLENEEDLARVYSAADVLVSASAMETFGQTLVEAAACGTPSIALGGSGTESAVRDGVSGLLVKDHTPEALAAAIESLMNDRSKLDALSFWAPVHVANEFSVYRSYYTIYQALEGAGIFSSGRFKRKIDFTQQIANDIRVGTFGHDLSIHSFVGMTGPIESYPPLGLKNYRWITAHDSHFKIYNHAEVREVRLVFSFRNYNPGQQLSISIGRLSPRHFDLHGTFEEPQLVVIPYLLPHGETCVNINCGVVAINEGGDDPQAALLADFLVV